MKYLLQKSRIQNLIQYRNGYLALAVCSLILNFVLTSALIFAMEYERIVIVPPMIEKSFWVSANQVSPKYLSEMSLFFANLRFNVTPSNAVIQRDVLLRYVYPCAYEALKTELVVEAEHLSKEHIATAFYPIDVQVNTQKLISRVTGELQSIVGDSILPVQHVTYQLVFTYGGGRLLVKSFEEVKSNA